MGVKIAKIIAQILFIALDIYLIKGSFPIKQENKWQTVAVVLILPVLLVSTFINIRDLIQLL